MSNQTINSVQNMDNAVKSQMGQMLILQTYSNGVLQQPKVDFSADPDLSSYQQQVNDGLGSAQGYANDILSNIVPEMIGNLSNISNYYQLCAAIPATTNAATPKAEWITLLGALKAQADGYKSASIDIMTSLQEVNNNMIPDAASFATVVSNINTAVQGDNGTLENITQQLNSLNYQIAGAITGTVFGALAIAGGVFTIIVGAVADFVTAGTSSELVIGGVVAVVAGIGTEAGTAIALAGFYSQKADLLQQQAMLTSEVSLLAGISSSYTQFCDLVKASIAAASQMQKAWKMISDYITSLIDDITNGVITDMAQVRNLFVTSSGTEFSAIQNDISTIKVQMTGIAVTAVPQGQNLSDYLLSTAQQN